MSVLVLVVLGTYQGDLYDSAPSCGIGAAYLLLDRLEQPLSLEQIEAASPVASDAPMSIADLKELFKNLGFSAEGRYMSLDRVDRPLIAYRPHADGGIGHFLVVEPIQHIGTNNDTRAPFDQRSATPVSPAFESRESANAAHFLVIDPIGQPVRITRDRLLKTWDGRVLVVYPHGVKPPYWPHFRPFSFVSWCVLGTSFATGWAAGSVLRKCRLQHGATPRDFP